MGKPLLIVDSLIRISVGLAVTRSSELALHNTQIVCLSPIAEAGRGLDLLLDSRRLIEKSGFSNAAR